MGLLGDVPKWLKGPDSKSGRRRKACGGSNPSISPLNEGKKTDILSATLRMPKGCRLFYFKFRTQKKRYFRVILVTGEI